MLSAARHRIVLAAARSASGIRVEEMARNLGVSASTIRRDLQELEKQRLITRVHGGAVALDGAAFTAEPEPPPRQRAQEHVAEKRLIGERAAKLITDGQTVLLGGGTTAEHVLPNLQERQHVTILTNNLHTAAVAAKNEALAVVVLGGYLRRGEMSLLGHLTIDPLTQLTIDIAMFGAYAIDKKGIMGADLAESETERALVNASLNLVVLADSSKFDRRGPIRLASANRISTLITDSDAPVDSLAALEEQGVTILRC